MTTHRNLSQWEKVKFRFLPLGFDSTIESSQILRDHVQKHHGISPKFLDGRENPAFVIYFSRHLAAHERRELRVYTNGLPNGTYIKTDKEVVYL